MRDAGLAEDAMHEAFLRTMKSGDAFRTAERPLQWLYRVADNACFDLMRKSKRLRAARQVEELDLVESSPHKQMELRDTALMLLDSLDETDQKIVVLSCIDGMNQAEIAEELGLSRVTINKRLGGLREKLELEAS